MAFKPSSGRLLVDADLREMRVKRVIRRGDESEWVVIDIASLVLPAGPLNEKPIYIRDRDDFFFGVAASLDTYLLRTKPSKSEVTHIQSTARTLCKFFEYIWLNGFFRITDVPAALTETLLADLKEGGWNKALRTTSRWAKFIQERKDSLPSLISESKRVAAKASLKSEALRQVGTNIGARELAAPLGMVIKAIDDPILAESGDDTKYFVEEIGSRSSVLRQWLTRINLLSDIPESIGLKHVPYPNPHKVSGSGSLDQGTTDAIDPDTLAKLLVHSYKWILDYGDAIATMLETIVLTYAQVPKEMRRWRRGESRELQATQRSSRSNYHLIEILKNSQDVRAFEELAGVKVATVILKKERKNSTSLKAILNNLYTACFIVIAIMNARRHDEICHTRIGLHAGSLEHVDKDLKLAVCEFYVEKYVREYVPFWVNEITVTAIELLERIATVAWEWDELDQRMRRGKKFARDLKLFVAPSLIGGDSGRPVQYIFGGSIEGAARGFIEQALGSGGVSIRAHMFRKAYGLVFHYRFEHPELLALMQKYQHADPLMTLGYVGDAPRTPLAKTAVARWSAPAHVVQRAHKRHIAEASSIVTEVGREKLTATISQVLSNSRRYSGGFAVLVSNLHKRFSRIVSYRELDVSHQVKKLSELLNSHGHRPHPMKDVTCMAGSNQKRASCVTTGKSNTPREMATPTICSGCPYSVIVTGHLTAMEREYVKLRSLSLESSGTLAANRLTTSANDLEKVIRLHKARLGLT